MTDGRITLPADVREAVGIQEGQAVYIQAIPEAGVIAVVPATDIIEIVKERFAQATKNGTKGGAVNNTGRTREQGSKRRES